MSCRNRYTAPAAMEELSFSLPAIPIAPLASNVEETASVVPSLLSAMLLPNSSNRSALEAFSKAEWKTAKAIKNVSLMGCDEEIEFVTDLFSDLGPLSTRKMFGGLGIALVK